MSHNTQTIGQLMPATNVEIAEAMRVLFNSLPFQRGTDPATAIIAYCEALRGSTVDAIRTGVSKFLRGECEGVSNKFVPTPPELARIVRTAIVPARVPAERQIAPSMPKQDERARMKLKMNLWHFAWSDKIKMEKLDKANREGFAAAVLLATEWNIPIPNELQGCNEAQMERDWQTIGNRARDYIERDPPPYLARQRKAETGKRYRLAQERSKQGQAA